MVDFVSPEKRSKIMRAIRGKDTKPELVVRKLLFSMGYRYRLHRRDIVGSPDIVFISKRRAIFVHGCFWHNHRNCRIAHVPDSPFWKEKLAKNRKRDRSVQRSLESVGWGWLVVWECQLSNPPNLKKE